MPSIDDKLVEDGTMSIAQAAEFTGYSRDTIEEMLKAEELPWTQLRTSGRRVIPKAALTALMKKNMVNGGNALPDNAPA